MCVCVCVCMYVCMYVYCYTGLFLDLEMFFPSSVVGNCFYRVEFREWDEEGWRQGD